jgi:hypothetical protein
MRTAFVIMPFSSTSSRQEEEWTEIFIHVFKPAFEEAGYICERAAPMTGTLLESIIDKLRNSHVVLADITDENSNVFYELGIRHSLRNGTIIVSQAAHDIPSDLRGLWHVQYGTRPAEVKHFKDEIKRLLKRIEEQPDRSDNPVSDFLKREHLSVFRFVQKDNIKKLGALITELGGNEMHLKQGETSSRFLLSYGCLDLLVQTMYIDPGPEILSNAYELRFLLKRVESGDLPNGIIEAAIQRCEYLFRETVALRESLTRGTYSEPENVSTMAWLSLPC